MIRNYIITETIAEFHLDKQHFFISETRKYREARMVCYHLFQEYMGYSHSTIARVFGKKRSSVTYFIGKCNEILSFPRSQRDFVERYREIERSATHYIGGLRLYTSRYLRSIKVASGDL